MQTAAITTASRRTALHCESLEDRAVPATAGVFAGTLFVAGTNDDDRIRVFQDGDTIRVLDGTLPIGTFDLATITAIAVATGDGNDAVIIDPQITQPATITGTSGVNKFVGGGGATTFVGGPERDVFIGSNNANSFNANGGQNDIYKVKSADVVFPNPGDRFLAALPPGAAPDALDHLGGLPDRPLAHGPQAVDPRAADA